MRPGTCAAGGCAFDQADIAAATDYAVAHGAAVINYSLGGALALDPSLSALAQAAAADRIVVFAAGNGGQAEPTFPALFAANSRPTGSRSRSARSMPAISSRASAIGPGAPAITIWSRRA